MESDNFQGVKMFACRIQARHKCRRRTSREKYQQSAKGCQTSIEAIVMRILIEMENFAQASQT